MKYLNEYIKNKGEAMTEKEFVEIESAGWNHGFYAGQFGTALYDDNEVKKAKKKLLKVQEKYLGVKP